MLPFFPLITNIYLIVKNRDRNVNNLTRIYYNFFTHLLNNVILIVKSYVFIYLRYI